MCAPDANKYIEINCAFYRLCCIRTASLQTPQLLLLPRLGRWWSTRWQFVLCQEKDASVHAHCAQQRNSQTSQCFPGKSDSFKVILELATVWIWLRLLNLWEAGFNSYKWSYLLGSTDDQEWNVVQTDSAAMGRCLSSFKMSTSGSAAEKASLWTATTLNT